MGLKNLTLNQQRRLYTKLLIVTSLGILLATKAVLQSKSSAVPVSTASVFWTPSAQVIKSSWDAGQIYTQMDKEAPASPAAETRVESLKVES
jgi:hypothetical protein